MKQGTRQKLFGIGLRGAVISLVLFAISVWIDRMIATFTITDNGVTMKAVGCAFIVVGLGLHFWAFSTLRNWWVDSKLCTDGPFKYFRHPMYAALLTFVSPGVALYFNSWIYLVWFLILHPIWHVLVRKEEMAMSEAFGDTYIDYARRTGRFVPRVFS